MSSSKSGAVSGSPLDRPLLQRSFTKSDTYIAQKFNKTKSMIERERNGTVMNSIFTLVSTIIGGGSLSLPYAFACTGLINGACVCACEIMLMFLSSVKEYCFVGISLRSLCCCLFKSPFDKVETLLLNVWWW